MDSEIRLRRPQATTAILDAVRSLLLAGGYSAVTTDSIAAAANVSKSTIYRRWPSKEDLVAAAAAQTLLVAQIDDQGSLAADLAAHGEQHLARLADEGERRAVSALIGAAAQEPKIAEVVSHWSAQLRQEVRRILERAATRGEIDASLVTDEFAMMLVGSSVFGAITLNQAPQLLSADHLTALIAVK